MTDDMEEHQERVMSSKPKEERSSSLYQILKSSKKKKCEMTFDRQCEGQPNLGKNALSAMEREVCLEGVRRDRS